MNRIDYPPFGWIRPLANCLLPLICCLCACAPANKTDEEKLHQLIVKNRIKSITEYVTNMHLGIAEKEHIHHVKLFNNKGLLTKETLFLNDEKMDFFALHEYDKNDNLVVTNAMKPDSTFFYKDIKIYDDNNNMKEKIHFERPDGPYYYRNSAEYDSKGRMTAYYWWWPTGLRAKEKYAYDGMKMIENIEYDPAGKFLYSWKYKYDENENLIEAVQYYPDSIINSTIRYEYDKHNRMVRQIRYFRETLQKTITYEYDTRNLLTAKTEYSAAGRISACYRYQYAFL